MIKGQLNILYSPYGQKEGIMTKDEVLKCILQTNYRTGKLYFKVFTELFAYEPEDKQRICLSNLMRFQQAWGATDAYSYAHDVLQKMREDGYDVKMDMQSYKLSYHGLI